MKKFNEVLSVLCIVYGKDFTPELAKAYAMVLGKYKERDLVNAGMSLMEGQYFPRPYDFKQIVDPDGILDKQTESAQDMAESAWDVLIGRTLHGSPEIPTRETFDAMKGICTQHSIKMANEFQINTYRKRFIDSYRSKDIRSRREDHALIEAEARKKIGDGDD